jgi:signal transduction histidine kinase/FixJ family two-component response regulator
MKVWAKKREFETRNRSVARAALTGASHRELIQEALSVLTHQHSADRVGVWLPHDPLSLPSGSFPTVLQGLVWDRFNPDLPKEWRSLSLEPPLPEELLLDHISVEQDLAGFPAKLLLGPLLGLRHALWTPVAGKEQVRGLILLGGKVRPAAQLRELAVSIAAELALALELQKQLNSANLRAADLLLARCILETCSAERSLDALLSRLAAECLEDTEMGPGPGAIFAVIGVLPTQAANSGPSPQVEFRWRSGDASWTRAVESEPLAKLWRRALEVRQMIGSEPPSACLPASLSRIVAYPLEARGQLLGVLVAGLPDQAASLDTLDRLELRALLAAFVLDRKRRLEEESARFLSEQALLGLLDEPLLLSDASGKITAFSRGAGDLLRRGGHSADTFGPGVLPAEHFSDLFCGRDRERVHRWLQDSLHSSTPGSQQEQDSLQAQLHNGIDVRIRVAPRSPGQPAAIVLQSLAAPESLLHPAYVEAELENVIEWLEEGVVLFDSQDHVRAMNTRFKQMMGLPPESPEKPFSLDALIARLADQATNPGSFAARWRELARGIEGGVREELHMAWPAPRILERAARPVLDSIGRQLGRVEIYRDLTAQRIFQSKLLQTEKLASLGQMVSGIAHELSNPLTSILGYAQRMLAHPDTSPRPEEIRQICQEAERASAILRQLLLNARETLPERRLVSLNQVVTRAMELQSFSLAAGKIRVQMDLDPVLPFVHGDPGQLQQVLMNLLGNAQQALAEQGQGGVIRMRTRATADRRVLLEVEDNGPGIPQAIQARIFDPFFTTKPAGVGTGLGLSIVLSVVREHGGQVRVLSPPQGGATFQVELPAASERQQAESRGPVIVGRKTAPLPPAAFSAEAKPHAPAFESRKGASVLVVEDEPTVARLIADVLEDEGMRVTVLLDGREALECAKRESYDLVICDMKMSGLDGQHFYSSLERDGNQLRERFLFVTGDIIASQTREFLERHRLPHVAKPFRVEELMEKVREVLQLQNIAEPQGPEGARKNAARNG